MSLKSRIIGIVCVLIVILVGSAVLVQIYETNKLSEETETLLVEMNEGSEESVRQTLQTLTSDISNQVHLLEEQINDTMLNAAYTLQQYDSKQELTNDDIRMISDLIKVEDAMLTDTSGFITHTTDDAYVDLNLFAMNEAHREVMSDDTEFYVSPLIIKSQTGEIFKFLSTAREDGRGVIEVGLEVGVFENLLRNYLENNQSLEALYLVDSTNIVLAESLQNNQESVWTKGETIENSVIEQVSSDATPMLFMEKESQTAEMYYPVLAAGEVQYVLYAKIDTEPYFLQAMIANQALENVRDGLMSNVYSFIIMTVIITAILILVLMFLLQRKLQPLTVISEHAENIAAGDFTQQALNIKSNDEIGKLAQSFNKMSSQLRSMIHQVADHTQTVASSSEQLSTSAEQMTLVTEQIAQTIEEVAAGKDKQLSSVQQTAETVEQMAGSVEQIALSADSVTSSAAHATKKAGEGGKSIQIAVEQMNSMNQIVTHTSKVIQGLDEHAGHIGKITKVITEIAEQTNLLALNAAIEAARAGEHGKGFAVVAAEVRKLAEQSSQSANQISDLLLTIQSETKNAVASMGQVTEEVSGGIDVVNDTGHRFEEIEQAIDEVVRKIKEVTSSVATLSDGTNQLMDAMTVVKDVAVETAAGSQNVSAATEEQVASMQDITSSSSSLSNMAEELQQLIRTFKV
ncbi:methyl-accepting chemotaxis protein [Halalkalibacter wakoensis JCM 9140]|uniref:Methyl-accepting chemotaxis protein n=1 Tax=Halalkalibacter wakoensis JCM 9140 TaxID=1236970 RepID=W4Q389_9BACI|nr:HAMP domain-containing methyl-accepting chemotaxis protein [Halalkalibacter wakoensis]GAE26541.1 methyl-accepting chemotaxis protein [Halalkalibacter wakoensis JCM 9140]